MILTIYLVTFDNINSNFHLFLVQMDKTILRGQCSVAAECQKTFIYLERIQVELFCLLQLVVKGLVGNLDICRYRILPKFLTPSHHGPLELENSGEGDAWNSKLTNKPKLPNLSMQWVFLKVNFGQTHRQMTCGKWWGYQNLKDRKVWALLKEMPAVCF